MGNPYQSAAETRVGDPYAPVAGPGTAPPSRRASATHAEEAAPDVSPGALGAPAMPSSVMPASAMPSTDVPVQRHNADSLTSDLLLHGSARRPTAGGGGRCTGRPED